MILSPFRKENPFNTLWKDVKFGKDLVDSMLNTLQALGLTNVSQLLLVHETINIPNEDQILFNNLSMRPL